MYKSHFTAAVLLTTSLLTPGNFENSNCVKGLEERLAPDLSSLKIRSNCSQRQGSLPVNDGVLTGYFGQYSWNPATRTDVIRLFLKYNLLEQRQPNMGHAKKAQDIIQTWENMNKPPKNNSVSQAAPPAL